MWFLPQRMMFTSFHEMFCVMCLLFHILLLRESNQHEILMHIHSNKLHKMFLGECLSGVVGDRQLRG